jgi:hypothetical protein
VGNRCHKEEKKGVNKGEVEKKDEVLKRLMTN